MPGYALKQELIPVGGVAALQIRSLLDRQQFSDPLGHALAVGISSGNWPLFGMVWPSGIHLAAAVAQRPLKAGENILEIGCGLALASLVCHRRGALVTASDCHPLAGSFLLENLRLNGLAPMRYCHGDWSHVPTQQPGQDLAPTVQGRFDLIMGSDVLYERDEGGALSLFIERHAMPVSEVLIVDPERGNRAAFTRRLQQLGYVLEETTLLREEAVGDEPLYRGRLLRYQRH
ncbi:class I SAM-dependent methyltransferase [Variovorax sp. HJSM1_2]|uniref:class I SAM-dependent methyltransferase n=1 Tax=Variovorax sp. HJSM1_2 TaxID=3366263 RepID=UPI003BCD6FC0